MPAAPAPYVVMAVLVMMVTPPASELPLTKVAVTALSADSTAPPPPPMLCARMPIATAPLVVMLPPIAPEHTELVTTQMLTEPLFEPLLPPPRVAVPVDVARPPPSSMLCATIPTDAPP